MRNRNKKPFKMHEAGLYGAQTIPNVKKTHGKGKIPRTTGFFEQGLTKQCLDEMIQRLNWLMESIQDNFKANPQIDIFSNPLVWDRDELRKVETILLALRFPKWKGGNA
jgi:hypothetical protein